MQLATMDEYEFSKYLENELDEVIDEGNHSPLILDLLNSAKSEIDFREIAQHIINDYNEENEI